MKHIHFLAFLCLAACGDQPSHQTELLREQLDTLQRHEITCTLAKGTWSFQREGEGYISTCQMPNSVTTTQEVK